MRWWILRGCADGPLAVAFVDNWKMRWRTPGGCADKRLRNDNDNDILS
jgi:hypothetical protein